MAWSNWSWHQQWMQPGLAWSASAGAGCGSGTSSRCELGNRQQQMQEAAAGPDRPLGAGQGGEALRGDRGQQPLLAPIDGAKPSGPAQGASSSCKLWLWCLQWVKAGLAPAAGASAGQDHGTQEQRISVTTRGSPQ
uniref:Uncharacterized protein n=1 Tax=Pipistrellus kuhlii TaxID=59472 RepID=A0A7J7XVW7_PIPKU|nr:hypothetical protein mPipKuh1_010475 [Pipistrellus kuhlii]